MSLKIYEIFHSLQGETSRIGLPTVFVRLTGCPMRCTYCDTAYAFSGGSNMEIADIVHQVASYGAHYVTVTGGEPLAQKECRELLTTLCDAGYSVSIETGGAMNIAVVDPRVSIILDIKTPASNESENNLWSNLEHLKMTDEVKFVVCNHEDYDWAKQKLSELKLTEKCPVLFSPSYQELNATELASWILADKLPVRMQVQLHKVLWGEKPGV
ncbi:MAG: 7-carboxy-7-deazaguanine synthase QueE [Methylophilaceae bacterium 17-44-8]|nr:MAG: 7-carboxy-7-deazaguanine synthase QueE [Methylophilales bacterium 28-44-11]OYZ10338.1 MAG: 7-carboxy-7-deazaguanine synthase QueE [Methylophilales bacterium 16-45-7]OZA06181.1 MAG: 7-carboxy-7-deazaguanine synthase QueE [Methylophilaceae bacterium 17-44-8]